MGGHDLALLDGVAAAYIHEYFGGTLQEADIPDLESQKAAVEEVIALLEGEHAVQYFQTELALLQGILEERAKPRQGTDADRDA